MTRIWVACPLACASSTAGFGGGTLDTLETYTPAANSWATRAPTPTARYSLTAVALDGRL